MAGFVNKTFDNTSPAFTYAPADGWRFQESASPQFKLFNNSQAGAESSDFNPSFTFVFPEAAIAFYYYAPFLFTNQHFIWIDTDPSSDNHETVNQFMGADNVTFFPIVLYVKRFDQPGVHNITIGGASQLSVDRVDLEVPLHKSPSSTTTPSSSRSASTSSTASGIATTVSGSGTVVTVTIPLPPTSGSPPTATITVSADLGANNKKAVPVGGVAGGIIGGLATLLVVLIAWLRWRRRRAVEAEMGQNAAVLSPFLTPSGTSATTTSASTTGGMATTDSSRRAMPADRRGEGTSPSTSENVAGSADGGLRQRQEPTRQREVDAGPVEGCGNEPGDTLPPEYNQIFPVRPVQPARRPEGTK